MTWTEHHSESERYAADAESAFRAGDGVRSMELYGRAAEAESKAFDALKNDKPRTAAVTAVSAVALWYKAREYAIAENLAYKWLSGVRAA